MGSEAKRATAARSRTSPAIGAAAALACTAFVVLAGVAIHELRYASSHPHAFGPAHVIALSAAGGAIVSVAVALLAWAMMKRDG